MAFMLQRDVREIFWHVVLFSVHRNESFVQFVSRTSPRSRCSEEVVTVRPQYSSVVSGMILQLPAAQQPRASWWIGEANGGCRWSPWGRAFRNLSGYRFHWLHVPGSRWKPVTADLENGHEEWSKNQTCLIHGWWFEVLLNFHVHLEWWSQRLSFFQGGDWNHQSDRWNSRSTWKFHPLMVF